MKQNSITHKNGNVFLTVFNRFICFSIQPIHLEFGYPNWSLQIIQIESISHLRSLFGICYCGRKDWEFDILFINFKF